MRSTKQCDLEIQEVRQGNVIHPGSQIDGFVVTAY